MSIGTKYALGLVLAAFLVAFGWYGHSVYDDSMELQLMRIRGAMALATAEEIAKIKVEHKTIYNKTLEKVSTEIQYRDCVADKQMVDLTNQAIMGAKWK